MTPRFFITGLPRSRSAWFAVATSRGDTVCQHEPSVLLNSYVELAGKWPEGTGVSDSSMALFAGEILNDLQPRTLIVERDMNQVIDSLVKYAGERPARQGLENLIRWLQRCQTALDECRSHPLVRWVHFEALDDPDELKRTFDWLLDGRSVPDLAQLSHMNVQCDKAWKLKQISYASTANRWVMKL